MRSRTAAPPLADEGLADLVPERVKEVRRRIIPRLKKDDLSADERRQFGEDMEDLFFIIQLFSYPGDYVAEKPSIERVAETLPMWQSARPSGQIP